MGVLSYSAQATMEMKFNRYFYASDVLNAIDNIYPEARSYQGTRMDDAMEIANYELFTPTGGSRDQISKVMIVLVSDPVADAKSRVLLRRLKYSGVSPVAVGVGANVKNDDLLKIADAKHTFSVGSYNDLITVAAKVVKSACESELNASCEDCFAVLSFKMKEQFLHTSRNHPISEHTSEPRFIHSQSPSCSF